MCVCVCVCAHTHIRAYVHFSAGGAQVCEHLYRAADGLVLSMAVHGTGV